MKLRSEMHEGFKLCPLFARLRREMSSPSPCLNLYFQTLLGTDMGIPLIRTGGTSENFKKDPIALLNHNPDFPIGRWTNTRVENNQLLGHLQLAPEGTSARIDEVRKLIFARVLCSCSVGFVPLEQELSGKGISFKRQRLLECSVVQFLRMRAPSGSKRKRLRLDISALTPIRSTASFDRTKTRRSRNVRPMPNACSRSRGPKQLLPAQHIWPNRNPHQLHPGRTPFLLDQRSREGGRCYFLGGLGVGPAPAVSTLNVQNFGSRP